MFGSCYCQFVSAVVHSHFRFSFTNAHVQLALSLWLKAYRGKQNPVHRLVFLTYPSSVPHRGKHFDNWRIKLSSASTRLFSAVHTAWSVLRFVPENIKLCIVSYVFKEYWFSIERWLQQCLFGAVFVKGFLIRKRAGGIFECHRRIWELRQSCVIAAWKQKNFCVEKITTTISIMFSNQMAYLKTKKQSVTGKHF